MPHDAKGRELKPGDKVLVPFIVKDVFMTEDYCNVNLESVATMPPIHNSKANLGAINTRMVIRANPGDETDFKAIIDGGAVRLE